MSDLRTLDAITPGELALVGGKALSLGLMIGAGLPVPPGFCVTTEAYRRLHGQPVAESATLRAAVIEAYHRLGGGRVAVRSSATAEDGSVTSFAGQQETVLGVSGEQAVLNAIRRCWASLDSERAVAYRRHQGVEESGLAMAVVVQRLVPAEVSGVLFTRDPLDATGQRMLVEASWGLGESVVSGRVTPDRFHVDRDCSTVLERHISRKTTQVTPEGEQDVPVEKQDQPCLDEARLTQLSELGRRVEAFYREPRDIEWGWADGQFWLLQARPITTAGAAERELVRREEIAALAAKAEPGGTVWARYNLAEVLPEPTPMTWAVVRRLLSGQGGMGQMYRDLGFDPDPALDEETIYDLVCGRPYCNLSREPRLQFRDLPFEHPFATLKAAPNKAIYPQPVLNPARAGWRFWLLMPVIFVKMVRAHARLRRFGETFAARFRDEVLPTFVERVQGFALADDVPTLLAQLQEWSERTLVDFARDSLKPTVLAAAALGNLEHALLPILGPDAARVALGELALHVHPDAEADLPKAFCDVLTGQLSARVFLDRFGHRGSQEMELAQPRWSEDPDAFERLLRQQRTAHAASPEARHGHAVPLWEGVLAGARLSQAQKAALQKEVEHLHTYLGLRETAKHFLLRGYAILRRILLELDRRVGLKGGIFYLTPEELPRVAAGDDLTALITQRRRRRALVLNLEVPPVLFSDDLEAIGRPQLISAATTLQGVPLSAGVAEGPALVLERPNAAELLAEPYILVCPSTDPAWVPLFVNARGLVMETGGVLSHGAIVAREFGLPAVAGPAGVLRMLKTGERVRVDGVAGTVTVLQRETASGKNLAGPARG